MSRIALVTGVSRRVGIGAAIAARLARAGYRLLLTGLPSYDDAQPYGGDPDAAATFGDSYLPADLEQPGAARQLVDAAIERYGALDVVVANHAYSTQTELGSLDAAEIDRHLVVNVRATLLLVEVFAAAYDGSRPDGRVVLFSSGQRLGPMPSELAYAASKAAVECLAKQLAYLLAPRGITVNCVNPGPTDTGYLTGDIHAAVAGRFPGGQWGQPDDAARLVEWLCSPAAGWITGQVIDSEGGFDRSR
jgi:3-oxoacyl-[acyl-carrier protein] reductase